MSTSSALRAFEERYRCITQDIYKFCDALNFDPTWQQQQLFDAVMEGHRRITCRSGQGPGKTTASGVLGLFQLVQAPWSRLVVTAPTMRQCKDVWLAEVTQILRRADPFVQRLFNVTTTSIGVMGQKAKDWGALLITSSKAENAQGQHRKDMHLICEEASGIPREIMEQYEGTLTNPNALFLQIGNPNTRDCAFFDTFHLHRRLWYPLHWNAEQTPESEWFSLQRNKILEEKYGRDSDVYRVRVLGEFPLQDPNCVLSEEQIQQVAGVKELLAKTVRMGRIGTGEPVRQFGIDFARFGGDESTIFRRSGYAIPEWERYSHVDPSRIIDKAFNMQRTASWSDAETWYVGDAGGMGQGVMHRFYEAGRNIVEFHSQGKAIDEDFDNKITEAWFKFSRLVKSRNCYIPADNILQSQLATRRYFTTRKGKLILESKDEYMKRGYDSPDRADGIVMAFWDDVVAQGNIYNKHYSGKEVGAVA